MTNDSIIAKFVSRSIEFDVDNVESNEKQRSDNDMQFFLA